MRRFVTIIMAMLLTAVTTMVPPATTAKALGLPKLQHGHLSLQSLAGKSQERPAVPAKPCPRGATILSCPFYAPSPAIGVSSFLVLTITFGEAKIAHPLGQSIAPPHRPPKPLSA